MYLFTRILRNAFQVQSFNILEDRSSPPTATAEAPTGWRRPGSWLLATSPRLDSHCSPLVSSPGPCATEGTVKGRQQTKRPGTRCVIDLFFQNNDCDATAGAWPGGTLCPWASSARGHPLPELMLCRKPDPQEAQIWIELCLPMISFGVHTFIKK